MKVPYKEVCRGSEDRKNLSDTDFKTIVHVVKRGNVYSVNPDLNIFVDFLLLYH